MFTLSAQKEALCVMFSSTKCKRFHYYLRNFHLKGDLQTKTQCTIDNNKSAFLSAISLLPEFLCSRKLISIVSRSRPLPASRPVSHVIKTHYFLGGHNVEERTVLFRFSTFFINNGRLHQIVRQGEITTT